MANAEKYVPKIIIADHRRHVTTLEAHLKAVRDILGETAIGFAVECGLDHQSYSVLENRGIGKNTRKKTAKIIDRLGKESSLEGNPHAEAVVTILTLEGLKKSWRKFEAERKKDKKSLKTEIRIQDLERDLIEPYRGEIIFRRVTDREVTINNGMETPDIRTDEQKWQDTIASASLGTSVRYIRCDREISRALFAKRTHILEEIIEEIEENALLPTSYQIDAIIANSTFAYDSFPAQKLRQKATELNPNTNTEIRTEGIDQELITAVTSQPTIGDALRVIRTKNRLSQSELGSLLPRIAQNKQSVSNLERGVMMLEDYIISKTSKKARI